MTMLTGAWLLKKSRKYIFVLERAFIYIRYHTFYISVFLIRHLNDMTHYFTKTNEKFAKKKSILLPLLINCVEYK